jgi:hypothetical protein
MTRRLRRYPEPRINPHTGKKQWSPEQFIAERLPLWNTFGRPRPKGAKR